MMRLNSPADLEELRRQIVEKIDPQKPAVTLCISTGCEALALKAF